MGGVELDQPLPSRARFLRERAEHERVNGITWTTAFPRGSKDRIYEAFCESYASNHPMSERVADTAFGDVIAEYSQHRRKWQSVFDVFSDNWSTASDEDILDGLDAIAVSLRDLATRYNDLTDEETGNSLGYNYKPVHFIEKANDILLDARISYTFINGRLKERGAEPLHVDVIQPVEAALTSDPRFTKAEAAYQDAVTSMATGHYGASITSAGSALQQTLVGLGAKGGDLGALFADARKHGFLMGHDEKLFQAFKSISGWITADRSNRGTAHNASDADRDDAQLAIHIVASLIIRLVKLAPVGTGDQE